MEDPGPKLILYPGRKGRPDFSLRVESGTVWLTQAEIAELFQTTKQNVSLHILNILKDRELAEDSVVKVSLTTAADGKNYRTKLYRLELILAVGYRVRSPRGTEFRQWATAHLSEYLVKGFVMDDERLKHPQGGWDHYWRTNVDRMLEFNERPVLQGPGRMSHTRMKEIVSDRYEEFNGRRREADRLAADAEDVKALESLAKEIEAVKPNPKKGNAE